MQTVDIEKIEYGEILKGEQAILFRFSTPMVSLLKKPMPVIEITDLQSFSKMDDYEFLKAFYNIFKNNVTSVNEDLKAQKIVVSELDKGGYIDFGAKQLNEFSVRFYNNYLNKNAEYNYKGDAKLLSIGNAFARLNFDKTAQKAKEMSN